MASVTPSEIALAPNAAALVKRDAAMEAAKRYAGKARSENTWRGYRAAWACFCEWCDEVHLSALPATPQTVSMFIAAEADKGRATATLEHRLAAIRLAHLGAGHASPHNTLAVLEVLKGIRRERRGRPRFQRRPAAPAIDEELQAMVNTLGTVSLRDLRDRALLLYGFATALRCSELVRLQVADIESREQGDVVTIGHSKGDQEGAGQTVAALAVPGSPYCPVSALQRWLQVASIQAGPLFRRIARNGAVGEQPLSDKTVVRLIKRCAAQAGLDATRYSGHSLRRGFLTSAAMNRADVLKMVAQSRHANINTILAYVDNQQLFDDHAGEHLLQPGIEPKASDPSENGV